MQMAQWLNLSDELRDKILGFVGEYDWRSDHLMIVAKSWWKKLMEPPGIMKWARLYWN